LADPSPKYSRARRWTNSRPSSLTVCFYQSKSCSYAITVDCNVLSKDHSV